MTLAAPEARHWPRHRRCRFERRAWEVVEEPEVVLPAWPVLCLLWGVPLWWASGLFAFCTVIVALPMSFYLIQSRNLRWTPGILPLIGLVVWALPSATLVESTGDLIGYAVRWVHFAALALTLVYVINARQTLTGHKILIGLCAWWVYIIAFGYLALMFPEARLSQTVGLLLPDGITSNEYARDLLFPPLSEIQQPYGAEVPFVRPAAPFPYANGWGAAMAILTPIVIATTLLRGTTRMWIVLIGGCAAMVVPMNASGNRGLLLTSAVVVVIVALRYAGRGHGKPLVALVLGVGALVLLLERVGVFASLQERQETVDTTAGRMTLYTETFTRSLESPLIGFGAPRTSTTTEITVGTQGMFWSMMFCFGFVGLGFFLWFFIGTVIRTWEAPNAAATWLNATVAASVVMSGFYGMDRQLIPLVILIGLMLREKYVAPEVLWPPRTLSLGTSGASAPNGDRVRAEV